MAQTANRLAKLGYAAIGFDYPYHKNGPRSERLGETKVFIEWIYQMLLDLRPVDGRPLYLWGHSFGPEVIAGLLYAHPEIADGVVFLSPGPFNKELDTWVETKTSQMIKQWPGTKLNEAGGQWAGRVKSGATWSRVPHSPGDPTRHGPRLRIPVGDEDEYFPGPLDEKGMPVGTPYYPIKRSCRVFANAVITIEPGIGHRLFDHDDAEGRNVMMRELLALDGIDALPATLKAIESQHDENTPRWMSWRSVIRGIFLRVLSTLEWWRGRMAEIFDRNGH